MAVILSINGNLDPELSNLGHEVISISIKKNGLYSALELFSQCTKPPSVFIQREDLAHKIIFYDVHDLPCRSVFWSIDTHLNYAWQMHYGALFDVFLTPHKNFIERLNKDWLHPNMHRLAQNGYDRPFIPHAQREHKLNFVGRLLGTRLQRERIVKFLSEKYNLETISNIFFTPMMELYDNTCIIPNESIANEVNFRLLEGASCGACVISPFVGPDQDLLLEPNKEVLIYHSMDELQNHIDHCLADPKFSEQIGYCAWQRVQQEHTKQHRAAQLLTAIEGHEPTRQNNGDLIQLTLMIMEVYNCWPITTRKTVQYNFNSKALELIIKIFMLATSMDIKKIDLSQVTNILNEANLCILNSDLKLEHRKMLAIACGGLALELGDTAQSFFYFSFHEKLCQAPTPPKFQKSQVQMAMAWLHALKREQKQCLIGIPYRSGCYLTAIDFSTLSKIIDPYDLSWAEGLATLDHAIHSFPMHERENIKRMLD